jgi:IclR family pca regulon transcriptional regulator
MEVPGLPPNSPAQPAGTRATPAPAEQLAAFTGDPNFMLSLARGLAVLEAFSERKRPLTISQVAVRTGLSRASVRRCLYTLEQLGYVRQQEGQYALRPRVLHLGHAYFSSTSLVSVAQPVLDGLSARLHKSCSLAVLEGTDILYLARTEVQRMLTVPLGLGSRLPAYCTSIGRLLLAFQPAPVLEAFFAQADLRPRTLQTKVQRAELEAAFAKAREVGYVVVDEELEPGVRAIAVPVRDECGTVLAGLSVGVRVEAMGEAQMVARLLGPMREAAAAIGRQGGGSGASGARIAA